MVERAKSRNQFSQKLKNSTTFMFNNPLSLLAYEKKASDHKRVLNSASIQNINRILAKNFQFFRHLKRYIYAFGNIRQS